MTPPVPLAWLLVTVLVLADIGRHPNDTTPRNPHPKILGSKLPWTVPELASPLFQRGDVVRCLFFLFFALECVSVDWSNDHDVFSVTHSCDDTDLHFECGFVRGARGNPAPLLLTEKQQCS